MGWGTSASVGDGLYKGTKLGAKNESTMDNSPLHDETMFDSGTGCLDAADVGLNSIAGGGCRGSGGLGRSSSATRRPPSGYCTRANALRARIGMTNCGTSSRKIFANRRWSGDFVKPPGPHQLLSVAGGCRRCRTAAGSSLAVLNDPKKFGGKWRLPSITRDDPAYHDNVYWRGRVWPPLNYLTYQGLKRAGLDEMAAMPRRWIQRRDVQRRLGEAGSARRISPPRPALPTISRIPISSMAGAR